MSRYVFLSHGTGIDMALDDTWQTYFVNMSIIVNHKHMFGVYFDELAGDELGDDEGLQVSTDIGELSKSQIKTIRNQLLLYSNVSEETAKAVFTLAKLVMAKEEKTSIEWKKAKQIFNLPIIFQK